MFRDDTVHESCFRGELMKYIKLIILSISGVLVPYLLIGITIIVPNLVELGATLCYAYPLYLPIFCGYLGMKFYKTTNKIFLPTLIFNLFLAYITYFSTDRIVDATGRDLGAIVVFLVLFVPTIYSVPISPIVGLICKHKKKKSEMQEIEKATANH